MFTFVNQMEAGNFETQLIDEYPSLKNTVFFGRYFPFSTVENELLGLSPGFNLKTEGRSVLGKPVYSVEIGQGKTKVLMWSQMHGNETTVTKAVFDLLKAFRSKPRFVNKILQNCTLKILPVLNPDGAEAYTRENHNGIDLNRDALDLSQPESRVLDKVFRGFSPDFCFNLHDQRTIYGAGRTGKPATLSFLAPSANEEKGITSSRETAMKLIVGLNRFLQNHIPGQVGRYEDEFNPNCTGERFQSENTPTLLFEAGHFPGDYEREKTRQLVFFSLAKVLGDISNKSYLETNPEEYFKIPENRKLFYDILIKNVSQNGKNFDLAIQYEENLIGKNLYFVPLIEKTGDLSEYFGHFEFSGQTNENLLEYPKSPKKGMKTEHLKINGEVVLLKLT